MVISSERACYHIEGELPYRCIKKTTDAMDCEEKCNDLNECIGFSEGEYCALFPFSKFVCPFGWMEQIGKLALSRDFLVPGNMTLYNCKVKRGRKHWE